MRKAAVGGSNYNVTCYIGFYTLRCMKMESKKKKKSKRFHHTTYCLSQAYSCSNRYIGTMH